MYRSFILGLLLSFAIMIAVGFWLTSRQEDPKAKAPPALPAAIADAPALPPGRELRPVAASARGNALQNLQLKVRAPTAKDAAEERDLEEAFTTAVRAGEEKPTGTVDKEHIRTAITAVKPLVNQCFQDVRQRYPPPQKVVLKFTLRGGGFSEGKLVDSTIADPWVEACVLDSLLDARFTAPASGEAVTLTYPFRFEQDAG